MISTEALRTCVLSEELSEEGLREIARVSRGERHEGGEAHTLHILQEGKTRLEYQICPQSDVCEEITSSLTREGRSSTGRR